VGTLKYQPIASVKSRGLTVRLCHRVAHLCHDWTAYGVSITSHIAGRQIHRRQGLIVPEQLALHVTGVQEA
jgi:hypothetical protein